MPRSRRSLPSRYDTSTLASWSPDIELAGAVLVKITSKGWVRIALVEEWVKASSWMSRCEPGDVVLAVPPNDPPCRIDDPKAVQARIRAAQRDS